MHARFKFWIKHVRFIKIYFKFWIRQNIPCYEKRTNHNNPENRDRIRATGPIDDSWQILNIVIVLFFLFNIFMLIYFHVFFNLKAKQWSHISLLVKYRSFVSFQFGDPFGDCHWAIYEVSSTELVIAWIFQEDPWYVICQLSFNTHINQHKLYSPGSCCIALCMSHHPYSSSYQLICCSFTFHLLCIFSNIFSFLLHIIASFIHQSNKMIYFCIYFSGVGLNAELPFFSSSTFFLFLLPP